MGTAEGTAARRPVGIRLIVAYKFVKAPVMLAIAVALTFWPEHSFSLVHHAVFQLSEWGAFFARVSRWLGVHLSHGIVGKAAVLTWLDAVSTFAEGILLLLGHAWGEWLVLAGLSSLLPFEAMSLLHHQRLGRAAVLLINLLVVVYLAWRRIQVKHAAHLREREA